MAMRKTNGRHKSLALAFGYHLGCWYFYKQLSQTAHIHAAYVALYYPNKREQPSEYAAITGEELGTDTLIYKS